MAIIGKTEIDAITQAAKEFNVPVEAMMAVAYQESKFNSSAKNPLSSALGMYQHIDSTWAAVASRYGSKYGITPATDRTNPKASALMGAALMAENMRGLIASGIAITTESLYSAHFAGLPTAISAYSANPTAKASEVFSASQIAANPSLLGGNITVAEALSNIEGKMGKAAGLLGTVPEIAEAIASVTPAATPLGGYPQTPIDGVTGINDWYDNIATPTPNPFTQGMATPKSYAPTVSDMHPEAFAPPQQASPIMPSPEQIAENWGQYQTPVNVTQQQQAQQGIQAGLDKISAMQPGYVENPGLGLSLPSGLDAFDHGTPTMQDTMENNRQAWSPAPPSGMPTDIDSSYATTAGNMNIDNTFAGDLTPDAFSPQTTAQQQPQDVPSMTDMVEQYGMYTNPAAPAYYDPVDTPMPAVVGANPQPSFYNTPAIDGIVGARQAIAAQEQAKINKEYEAGQLKAEEEAEKQKVFQDKPSLLGSLGIPGVTNKTKGFLGGMVSNIAKGVLSGGSGLFDGNFQGTYDGPSGFNPSGFAGGTYTGASSSGLPAHPSRVGGTTYGGMSSNFPGKEAHYNDATGITTVSDDNMSFIDNSEGASPGADGGATVLCTHYFNKGWLPADVYAADALFGAIMPNSVMAFYHSWAKPLVKQLEKRPMLEKLCWPVIFTWAYSIHIIASLVHKRAIKCQKMQ
ncbi:MAG: transglycosylase SLT domain-containing protein [Hyphomicrobiales bacterium]|nr:transglycosylase SLT domain-containing protein [Hyphomicrobiales bacterium]